MTNDKDIDALLRTVSDDELALLSPGIFAKVHLQDWGFQLVPHIAHIDELVTRGIDKGNARYLIEIPPRHGKSTYISWALPAWYLIRNPRKRVILASYESNFAKQWGRRVRDLISDIGERYGVRVNPAAEAVERWELQQRQTDGTWKNVQGGMSTAGAGGAITGKGADLLIIDDPFKSGQEAKSPTIRANIIDWWQSTARTRIEPMGSCLILHTRWHETDLIGYLLKQMEEDPSAERWDRVRLPALAEDNDPLHRRPGRALWPARYDEEALEMIRKDVGEQWFAALYQQRPQPLGGGIFQQDAMQHFLVDATEDDGDILVADDIRVPLKHCTIFSTVDLAASQRTSADFTVVLTCAYHRESGKLFCLDMIRKRLEGPDQVPMFKAVHTRWGGTIGMEGTAFQLTMIQAARRAGLPIKKLDADGDKVSRALVASAMLEGGNIYFRKGAPWLAPLLEEMLLFPNAQHDDTVDALSYAAIWISDMSRKKMRLIR